MAASAAELSALLQAQLSAADAEAAPAFGAWDEDAPAARGVPASPAARDAFPAPATAAGPEAPPAFSAPPAWTAAGSPGSGGRPVPAAPAASGAPHRVPGPDPAAVFEEARELDPAEAAAAEEMLVERVLDRLDERMRDESIRRFGLTGGVI
jgi:hypothetical protein